MYWITYIPQWATFATLSSVGRGIADLMKLGEGINLTPSVSESFLNGKKKLAQFYISQTFKYWTFFAVPMVFIIATYLPKILAAALDIQGAETYVLATAFIVPWMIYNFQENPTHTADMIIVGASKPTFLMMTRLIEETGKLILMTTWILWLKLPQTYGLDAIVWIISMGIWPAVIGKTIAGWWFINKKIVKVKVPIWQTFIAPLLASLTMVILSLVYLNTVHVFLVGAIGLLPAGVIAVLIAFIGMFGIVYLSAYGFFGGYDTFGFQIFKNAVKISGPSKWLMKIMELFLTLGIKISPLHNRFAIPDREAKLEAYELMEIRDQSDKRMKEENKK